MSTNAQQTARTADLPSFVYVCEAATEAAADRQSSIIIWKVRKKTQTNWFGVFTEYGNDLYTGRGSDTRMVGLPPDLRVMFVHGCNSYGYDLESAWECAQRIHAIPTDSIFFIVTCGDLNWKERPPDISLMIEANRHYVKTARDNMVVGSKCPSEQYLSDIHSNQLNRRLKSYHEGSDQRESEIRVDFRTAVDPCLGGPTGPEGPSAKVAFAAISAAAYGVSNIITWEIRKETPTRKIGLTFSSRNNRVIIDKVQGRASRETDLVAGLRVLKVCGHEVTTASECYRLIEAAPIGVIFIITEGEDCTATKQTKNEKPGIRIKTWSNKKYVQVTWVNRFGIFGDLKVGQVLYSINGKKISNVRQALRLLRTKRKLKLVTVDLRTAVDPFDIIGENDQCSCGTTALASQWSSVCRGNEGHEGGSCKAVTDLPCFHRHCGLGLYTGIIDVSTKQPHGAGRIVWVDKNSSYEGFWEHGWLQGHGKTCHWNDGDIHEGNYVQDLRHGPGMYYWQDGKQFVGTYKQDKSHGPGVFTYPNGDVYDGNFDYGRRSGFGTFTFRNKTSQYQGEWKSNNFSGSGTLRWQSVRETRFVDESGQRITRIECQHRYEGNFQNGLFHGEGVQFENGEIVRQGLWREGHFVHAADVNIMSA